MFYILFFGLDILPPLKNDCKTLRWMNDSHMFFFPNDNMFRILVSLVCFGIAIPSPWWQVFRWNLVRRVQIPPWDAQDVGLKCKFFQGLQQWHFPVKDKMAISETLQSMKIHSQMMHFFSNHWCYTPEIWNRYQKWRHRVPVPFSKVAIVLGYPPAVRLLGIR